MPKVRADLHLVARGLAESRSWAQALLKALRINSAGVEEVRA